MRGLSFLLAVLAVVAGAASRIHSQGPDHPFAGSWTANMQKSKLSPSFDAASITLRIDLAGDSMTMASRLVSSTGPEQRAAETFRTDGTVTPGTLSPNVTLVAKWLDRLVLASLAKKDGQIVAIVTYEISAGGTTLISRSSGTIEQTIVYERSR